MLQNNNIPGGSSREVLAGGLSAFRMAPGRNLACLGAVAALLLVLHLAVGGTPVAAQDETGPWKGSFSKDSRVVVTPEGIDRLLFPPAHTAWKPGVARFRGGTDLYAKVAPAVVVVRTSEGHGTGFLINADGWILTNHHVVNDGLVHDPARQASYAMVHLGRLGADGTMGVTDAPVRAYVYKMDRLRDLALLKVDTGATALPFLTLSASPPRPGMSASMVGHPASGMLWTFRTGQISASGRAPADLVDLVMARLTAVSSQRDDVAAAIRQLPSRRIVLSSCEANPGDSGGPLVDDSGQVLAVTFAIPGDPTEAKFTYHIHLDEAKAFLASRPTQPMLVVPDAWDAGPRAQYIDYDGDKRSETLMLGDDEPEMLLIDLSGRTVFTGLQNEDEAYKKLVKEKGWRFDVALQLRGSEVVVHYDTDRDGVVDLIQIGAENKKADVRMVLNRPGLWTVAAATGPVLSYELLGDAPRQKRLHAILQAMEKARKAREGQRK
jgi:S1-C subfamily serine protease